MYWFLSLASRMYDVPTLWYGLGGRGWEKQRGERGRVGEREDGGEREGEVRRDEVRGREKEREQGN